MATSSGSTSANSCGVGRYSGFVDDLHDKHSARDVVHPALFSSYPSRNSAASSNLLFPADSPFFGFSLDWN